MEKINERCNRCRFEQNALCVNPASDFYLVETDCDVVDFSKCQHFFSQIDDENLQADRENTEESLFGE